MALAGGLAIVPAIGSQGAGALGERHRHTDSHLLRAADHADILDVAERLAEQRVVALARQ